MRSMIINCHNFFCVAGDCWTKWVVEPRVPLNLGPHRPREAMSRESLSDTFKRVAKATTRNSLSGAFGAAKQAPITPKLLNLAVVLKPVPAKPSGTRRVLGTDRPAEPEGPPPAKARLHESDSTADLPRRVWPPPTPPKPPRPSAMPLVEFDLPKAAAEVAVPKPSAAPPPVSRSIDNGSLQLRLRVSQVRMRAGGLPMHSATSLGPGVSVGLRCAVPVLLFFFVAVNEL